MNRLPGFCQNREIVPAVAALVQFAATVLSRATSVSQHVRKIYVQGGKGVALTSFNGSC